MTVSTGAVNYGKKTIDFSILYLKRKTLEIAVHPDCAIIIKAPLETRYEIIKKKVVKRIHWIIKQLNYFQQFEPKTPQRQYLGGETHLYLGKQYRLKIEKGRSNCVKLKQGYFQIELSQSSNPEKVKILLESWYLERSKIKFNEYFDKIWSHFEKRSFIKPTLKIRRMKKRWGSLSKNLTLTLNPDLILTPTECIEYVITHELCHRKFHNHNTEFYRLLEKVMPDWEKRKHKLELALV